LNYIFIIFTKIRLFRKIFIELIEIILKLSKISY